MIFCIFDTTFNENSVDYAKRVVTQVSIANIKKRLFSKPMLAPG